MNKQIPRHILPVIVFSQFAGTSLWFAGNAVVPDLVRELGLLGPTIGYITMAVQAGFIVGTLVFAILNVADRISPVKVFLACSFLGAIFNALTTLAGDFTEIILARFFTGFFLAGIYPVGMKIASDWHEKGLGKALGYLVGALVVGTAFPHFLKYAGGDLPWRFVLHSTSVVSFSGGLLLYLTVPDGPYKGKTGAFKPSALFTLFKNKNFRSAAFGYFGHMWELYTFWAFVPVMLAYYVYHSDIILNIPLWSFIIIGIGGASCAVGGHFSLKWGSKKVAYNSLLISGLCCLLIPFLFQAPAWIFVLFLLTWGIFVIPDSPQFSAMVAGSADRSYVATGLTIVNSIGFAITILSIQLVNFSWISFDNPGVFWIMLFGPLIGLLALRNFKTES
ncbi:MAG: MFS transporter [Gracilimonas sp.]|uniref:MFS transporter n=1 Tax=Gracilimonas sp. TaxID=1974203 RepID=UPI00198C7634|nr:MFS transporter [Gracilimonas sp.]MBD3617558.1 MFS transporter [Gracilimonas sp.]